ncbi:MAG TPA: chemotaxis protein CheW, partial [Patescibacteria group bacterium]|nr:chemotaxis protein CheW [Patescibacteria group bacterium]
GGAVSLASQPGLGTTISLSIPLTLAIIPALIVSADGMRYALPRNTVREIVHLKQNGRHRLRRIEGARFLPLRDQLLPVASLQEIMGGDSDAAKALNPFVAVLQLGSGEVFGLICDAINAAEEIVVKPLSPALRSLRLFSGNALLGDGGAVLILEPGGLAREAGIEGTTAPDLPAQPRLDRPRRPALIFRTSGGEARRALPLENLARIERVNLASAERADGRLILPYRGGLLPVTIWPGAPDDSRRRVMLVLQKGSERAGLIVEEVLDVADSITDEQLPPAAGSGIAASALVDGNVVEVIDVGWVIARATGAAP